MFLRFFVFIIVTKSLSKFQKLRLWIMPFVLKFECFRKSIHSLTQSINLFIYPCTYLAISKLFECTNHEDETWKASAQTLPLMVNKGLSLQYGVTGNSFGGENNRRKFLVKNRRKTSKQALQKCYCLAFLGNCDQKKQQPTFRLTNRPKGGN